MYQTILVAMAITLANSAGLAAGDATEGCCEAGSPFVLGEAFPENPATCQNIEHWASRAPQIDTRVSMTITGELTVVDSDGMLAYLVMCEEDQMRVLCVTYSTEGREVGEEVLLAGGYAGGDDRMVVLDPCLASAP